jgi:hypothetical protein
MLVATAKPSSFQRSRGPARDDRQHAQRDPMVEAFDGATKAEARDPAEHGHAGLEDAEGERDLERAAMLTPFKGQSVGDGHRERIHGQAHSDEQDGGWLHEPALPPGLAALTAPRSRGSKTGPAPREGAAHGRNAQRK